MLRTIALFTLVTNPPLYMLLKGAAVQRHKLWNKKVEGGDGDLRDTWHEVAIDWIYPV